MILLFHSCLIFRPKKERVNIRCNYYSRSFFWEVLISFIWLFWGGGGDRDLSQSDPTQGSAFPELGLGSLALSNSPTVSLRTPAFFSHLHIKSSLGNSTLKIFQCIHLFYFQVIFQFAQPKSNCFK